MKPLRRTLTVLALTTAAILGPVAAASATPADSAWGLLPVDAHVEVQLPVDAPLPVPLDSAWG